MKGGRISKIGVFFKTLDPRYEFLSKKLTERGINYKCLESSRVSISPEDEDIDLLYMHPKDAFSLPEFASKLPNLKWVQCQFAGVETFICHKDLFKNRGIIFSNAKGVFSPSLGEFTVAYMLYWEKNLGKFKDLNSTKSWEELPNGVLLGKTVGIVGYGDIGAEVAQRLKFGFGMNVIGLKNSLKNPVKKGLEFVDELIDKSKIDYLLENSDYVVSILPRTGETENFFDESKFAKMKKGSIFINIGRGVSVVEEDLIKYLKSKETLRAASLDVTRIEPLPKNSELWELPNCYITNHSADSLDDGMNNQKLAIEKFIDLIDQYRINGELNSNLIDLELGY